MLDHDSTSPGKKPWQSSQTCIGRRYITDFSYSHECFIPIWYCPACNFKNCLPSGNRAVKQRILLFKEHALHLLKFHLFTFFYAIFTQVYFMSCTWHFSIGNVKGAVRSGKAAHGKSGGNYKVRAKAVCIWAQEEKRRPIAFMRGRDESIFQKFSQRFLFHSGARKKAGSAGCILFFPVLNLDLQSCKVHTLTFLARALFLILALFFSSNRVHILLMWGRSDRLPCWQPSHIMMPKNVFLEKMSARSSGMIFGVWNRNEDKRIVHDQALIISVLPVWVTITIRQD